MIDHVLKVNRQLGRQGVFVAKRAVGADEVAQILRCHAAA